MNSTPFGCCNSVRIMKKHSCTVDTIRSAGVFFHTFHFTAGRREI